MLNDPYDCFSMTFFLLDSGVTTQLFNNKKKTAEKGLTINIHTVLKQKQKTHLSSSDKVSYLTVASLKGAISHLNL